MLLGINLAPEEESGWFGKGKISAITSVCVLLMLIGGILLFVYLTTINIRGETNINLPSPPVPQTVVPLTPEPDPTAPLPVKPTTTPEIKPAPSAPIKAEDLVRQFLDNPKAYPRGTVLTVSGAIRNWGKWRNLSGDTSFCISEMVRNEDGYALGVMLRVDLSKEKELTEAFNALHEGDLVVIRGTFASFYSDNRNGVNLDSISIVSVTPAK